MSSDSGFASLGPSLLARKGGAKPAMRPQVAPLVAPLVSGESAIPEEHLEDLGWNDMGDSELPGGGAEIVPISADVAADGFSADENPIVRRQQRRLEERVLADAAMTGPQDEEPDYDEPDYDGDADYAASLYGDDADEDYADEEEDDADGAIYSPLDPLVPIAQPAVYAPPAPVLAPLQTPARAPRKPATARVPAVQSGRRAAFTLRLDADRHLKLRLAATMQGVSAQALVTEALDRLLAEYDELDVIANHLKRH
jgi:hypothetical protein